MERGRHLGQGKGESADGGYNRYVKQTFIVCTLLAVVCLSGCRKNIQSDDAVRQGVMSYLSQNKNLSLSAMDIEVKQVTYRDNEADAVVLFKPKGGDASSGMSMRYTLERQGNEWVVKKKTDNSPHGTAAAKALSDAQEKQAGAQQAAPAASGSSQIPLPTPSGSMPPGHPATGGEAKK